MGDAAKPGGTWRAAEDRLSAVVDAASTAEHEFSDEEQRSGEVSIQWAHVRAAVHESATAPVNDFERQESAAGASTEDSDGSLRIALTLGPIVPLVDLRRSSPLPPPPAEPSVAPAPAPSGPVPGSKRAGRVVAWALGLGLVAASALGLWSAFGH
jgi:hypothetical protein